MGCRQSKTKTISNGNKLNTIMFTPLMFLKVNNIQYGIITKIIDGDTYDVVCKYVTSTRETINVKMRIRLIGGDAPETKLVADISEIYRTKAKFAGLLVKQYVTDLIDQRQCRFIFQEDGKCMNDKYGRLLIDIEIPSLNIGSLSEHLLNSAYIKPYSGKTKVWTENEIDYIVSKLSKVD